MFEDVSKTIGGQNTHHCMREHVKSLYRKTLAKVDGNFNSMHAVLVKATRETTDKI